MAFHRSTRENGRVIIENSTEVVCRMPNGHWASSSETPSEELWVAGIAQTLSAKKRASAVKKAKNRSAVVSELLADYDAVLGGVVELLEAARRAAARAVNAVMTATYWEIGRRIVEFEQGGESRQSTEKSFLNGLVPTLPRSSGVGLVSTTCNACGRFTSPGRPARFTRRHRVNRS